MIKMIRVDYRLLHGQVAVSWTSMLCADCILLVSDTVLDDKLRLSRARPRKAGGMQGRRQEHRGRHRGPQERRDGQVQALHRLRNGPAGRCRSPQAVGAPSINLGNIPFSEDARQASKSIFLTEENEAYIKSLLDAGVDLFVQMVPSEAKRSTHARSFSKGVPICSSRLCSSS